MPPDRDKDPMGPGCWFFLLPMDTSTGGLGGAYSRQKGRTMRQKEEPLVRRMLDGGKEGTMSDLGDGYPFAQRRGGDEQTPSRAAVYQAHWAAPQWGLAQSSARGVVSVPIAQMKSLNKPQVKRLT